MKTLVEQAKVIQALNPAADGAGRAGDIISLKNCGLCTIVVNITQGNAATVALTIQQCQDVSGTGAKAITNAVPIWANQDLASSDALTRQTDAVSFTTSAAVKHKLVVFQIDPASLDLANGFDCIKVTTGASNAANITQALYILTQLRFAQATPPSGIVD